MGSLDTLSNAPPVLDFSAFRGPDPIARAKLIENINAACRDKGFFQLTNTNISPEQQHDILVAAKGFFDLPLEEKMKCHLSTNKYHRGYEQVGAQMLEPGTNPDTKEAVYIGEDLPADNPRVLAGEYNCGPNLYPDSLGKPFQDTCMKYYYAAREMAKDVMRALALGLGLEEEWFDDFINTDPSCTLRLIHYPPTPTTGEKDRGVGAHRDFGCLTVLLQDEIGGLQVQDEKTGEWLDVTPVPGAFVVNLGNAMMRWTNHHYTSNTHRVMNYSGKHRYSVPFFFNGNPKQVIGVIPGCELRKDTTEKVYGPPLNQGKYAPLALRDYLHEQFETSYARVAAHKAS